MVGVGSSVSTKAGYVGAGIVDGPNRSSDDKIGVGDLVVARRTQWHAEEISGSPTVVGR